MREPMRIHRRHVLQLPLHTFAPSALIRAARAEDFPTRSIRLVIPFPPGGIQDALGRPWAEKMRSLLGTVAVENIGGGGGELGAATVARAKPDGYTVVIANSSIMVPTPPGASRERIDHHDAAVGDQ